MTDNVLQTLQQLVQDVIASDVRELKVRQASFERLVDERFNAVDGRFDAQSKQSEMQFKTLLSAINESKAQSELACLREISDLRERIAVIESKLSSRAS